MQKREFDQLISDTDVPVILDIWAPWCGPCKAMKPHFDALAEEFSDRARVVAVNADESTEVVRELQVSGIPTVVVYRDGDEVARRMGAQSQSDLRGLFEAAIEGRDIPCITRRTRFIRVAVAALMLGLATEVEPAWPMWVGAAGFFFSAVHDRCPLMQALRGRIKIG